MNESASVLQAKCISCGAVLSLAHHGRARCVFCLKEQPLPSAIATPLRESAQLSEQLERMKQHALPNKMSWVIIGLIVAMTLPGTALVAWIGVSSLVNFDKDPLKAGMTAAIAIGGTLPVIAIPILWGFVTRKTRIRVFAALPPAVPQVESDHWVSDCPNCGARHQPTGALAVTCSYCHTEALAPLPLVAAGLASQHQAAMRAKLRGEAEANAAQAAVKVWQGTVVPVILGFCTLLGFVVIGFVVYAKLRGP